MPYPVLPPDPPPVVSPMPGEFNDAAIATPNPVSSEYLPAEADTSSALLSTLLESRSVESQSVSQPVVWAEPLGTPLHIGLPVDSPSQAPSTSPEPFTSTISAATVPELSSDAYFVVQEDAPTSTPATPETPVPNQPSTDPPTDPPTDPTNGASEDPASDAPEAAPTAPVDPAAASDVIELDANRQEYDEQRQVFQAEGNVELRFRGAVLNSDRLFVNIPNRIAVADGNAILTRGEQVLQGDRIEYNLVQNQGLIRGASGEIFLPSIAADTAAVAPADVTTNQDGTRPLTDRLSSQQPLEVTEGQAGPSFGLNTPNQLGSSAGTQGQINRLRYEADEIEFMGEVWEASNVRITNDPFSPPELELRSNRVTVTPLGPQRTEIRARNPRLVFDQGFSLPLLQDRLVIDNRERNPGLFSFGFDERDRGGFFIERAFDFTLGQVGLLTLTPQVFVQRGIDEGFGSLDSYGLIARLTANPTPTTLIRGNAIFTTFDFEDFEDTFRGSFRVQQQVVANHTVALEYSYRDRLYNGSLGFQDVQSSLGLVVTSPNVLLGNTGINLNYQAGVQLINANANGDRLNEPDINDLLNFNEDGTRDNNRIDLTRYQASATLNRFFLLWSGTALPRTPDQGLRYTPNPVVPFIGLNLGARGVVSAYSNGDTQSVFTGTIGLSGQFGQFSRPFLDYTGFNISYSYNAVGGETPFDFDRVNDIQVLSLGLTQQIYGPFRFGVRSTLYLESRANRENDADTTFSLEYSRRTYSINLSYSPQRQSGAIGFRINDFNWVGDPGPFSTGLGASNELGGLRIPGE